MRIDARDLQLALGQGELDETRDIAEEIALSAESWSLDRGKATPMAVREVERLARQMVKELDEAYPKSSQLLSEKDRRRIRAQTVQQREVLGKTRKLRSWIREQGEETRFLSHQALISLRTAAEHMGDAVLRLEEKQVRPALTEQSAALEELTGLLDDLKRGGETTPLESQPMVLQQMIEIPDPDEYKVPPEFREDILNAMRGELPLHYREAIKRYYETLVH
jgi:hypothetical protein